MTGPADIKKIIREYYKELYAHKYDSLEKMDQFLRKHKPLKLTQQKTDHLKSPTTLRQLTSKCKNPPQKISQGPNGFNEEFYQMFKELAPVLYNLF